jgi:hypothetical protein
MQMGFTCTCACLCLKPCSAQCTAEAPTGQDLEETENQVTSLEQQQQHQHWSDSCGRGVWFDAFVDDPAAAACKQVGQPGNWPIAS